MEQLQIPGIETGPDDPNENGSQAEVSEEQDSEISIPDKFKNEDGSVNVNSLLKSYTELEKSKTTPPENKEPEPASMEEAVKGKSLSPEEALHISDEIAANGEVSQKTYDLLESKGLSKEMSESYLEGQRALAQKMKAEIWEPVGGEEAYGKMLEWAADNMTPSEIATYDKIMLEGDMSTKRLTVQGLAARYQSENPNTPTLMKGNAGSVNSSNGFESWAQVTEAMRDPRYDKDEAYRRKVEERLAVSKNI